MEEGFPQLEDKGGRGNKREELRERDAREMTSLYFFRVAIGHEGTN